MYPVPKYHNSPVLEQLRWFGELAGMLLFVEADIWFFQGLHWLGVI